MSIKRQENWLGQQRVDVPHLRSVESSICNDFDLLAGTIFGGRQALVISGFYLVTTGVTRGEQLQLQVANGTLMHFYASESGSIFQVAADRANETLNTTNPRVTGSWTPSQVNYVGIDLSRAADDTTVDSVQFIDTTSLTETPKSVPLARTLDYQIIISTTDFSSNPSIAPLAKVTLDSTGSISSVVDARNLCFRLGTGGTTPSTSHAYPWPAGRKEGSAGDPFLGGDKAIASLKEWIDAVMTRTWELGGGEFWYSSTADRNVKLARTGSTFTSTGENFEWTGTNLHWQGLVAVLSNATGAYNTVADQTTDLAGLTDLADGQCIYVDLDYSATRSGGTALTPVKATLSTLGSPVVPGSRWVLAWRYGSQIFTRDHGWAVGSSFKAATRTVSGTVKVTATPQDASSPVAVLAEPVGGIAIAGGLTRGGSPPAGPSLPTDFTQGSGNLTLGGYSNDRNIYLITLNNADTVQVQGTQPNGAGGAASLTVYNSANNGSSWSARAIAVQAPNVGTSRVETGFIVYQDGSIGLRNVFTTGGMQPVPTVYEPIRMRIYGSTNGLATPNTRDQLWVIFSDNTAIKIAESGPY